MVNNIADAIENYIRQQLSEQKDGKVELKRTELANIISCAPSQISYVLSTRFTHDKGFTVESRRGLGGYIRITVVETEDEDKIVNTPFNIESTKTKQAIYKDMLSKIDNETEFEYIKSMIDFLLEHQMVTKREAELCAQFIFNLFRSRVMPIPERTKMIRSVFITLSKMQLLESAA